MNPVFSDVGGPKSDFLQARRARCIVFLWFARLRLRGAPAPMPTPMPTPAAQAHADAHAHARRPGPCPRLPHRPMPPPMPTLAPAAHVPPTWRRRGRWTKKYGCAPSCQFRGGMWTKKHGYAPSCNVATGREGVIACSRFAFAQVAGAGARLSGRRASPTSLQQGAQPYFFVHTGPKIKQEGAHPYFFVTERRVGRGRRTVSLATSGRSARVAPAGWRPTPPGRSVARLWPDGGAIAAARSREPPGRPTARPRDRARPPARATHAVRPFAPKNAIAC